MLLTTNWQLWWPSWMQLPSVTSAPSTWEKVSRSISHTSRCTDDEVVVRAVVLVQNDDPVGVLDVDADAAAIQQDRQLENPVAQRFALHLTAVLHAPACRPPG